MSARTLRRAKSFAFTATMISTSSASSLSMTILLSGVKPGRTREACMSSTSFPPNSKYSFPPNCARLWAMCSDCSLMYVSRSNPMRCIPASGSGSQAVGLEGCAPIGIPS